MNVAFIDTRKLASREPKPGWHGRFFDSDSMSFALYRIEAGAALHEHAHANEEVWNVVSGELEITIGGDVHVAGPGCAALVPPNTAHSVRALRESEVIVVDSPLRAQIGTSPRAAFSIAFDPLTEEALASDTLPLTLGYEVANVGRDWGVLRAVELRCGVASSLPEPVHPITQEGALPDRLVLGEGDRHHAAYVRPALTPEERESLLDGDEVLFVRGVVLYEDAAGERHHTTFCRVLDGELRFVAPEKPGYNYGD